jgi:lysophospholipase L1-like esterase
MLIFLVIAAVIIPDRAMATAEENSSMQWLKTDVAEGAASGWYRCALDASVARSEAAHLTIAADGRCSVYVNGQRVLKNVTMEKSDNSVSAVGFDIKSLLRDGRNLIAVESNSDGKSATFGISLVSAVGGKTRDVAMQWKTAPKQPPVGWQQTDFNDRDWPEAKPQPTDSVTKLVVSAPKEFPVPVIPPKARTAPFRFEDGDHVVLVGATFFERAQLSEHIEATFAATLGDKHVTFRNLGWSADTVYADSRGIFDRPEVGFLRMVEHIRAEEPTVAFLCYGQNEALTAGMTAEQYVQQLNRLIDELEASGIACVLISPHELLPAAPPIPSPSRFNSKIKVFSEATQSLAQARGLLFVDLFTDFSKRMTEVDAAVRAAKTSSSDGVPVESLLADNGMHLSAHGYACAALVLRERLLSIPATGAVVRVDAEKQSVDGENVSVRNVKFGDDASLVTFEVQETQMSALPLVVTVDGQTAKLVSQATIQSGEEAESMIEMGNAAPATKQSPRSFVVPVNSQYEALRGSLLKKNELYFHRWRPQNITYLFGFRKHEQGNNAADIARFDPFIQQLEKEIHEQQKPGWRTVVLIRK